MNWDQYEVFDPGVSGPMYQLSRDLARRAFEKVMNERPLRRKMLARLLEANGIGLDASDECIAKVNAWFLRSVEPDPEGRHQLKPEWYSVVNDIALWLGDTIIERTRSVVSWKFWDLGGKKHISHHRHVLFGFRGVPNKRYTVDIDLLVAQIGYGAVKSRGTRGGTDSAPTSFLDIVHAATRNAQADDEGTS